MAAVRGQVRTFLVPFFCSPSFSNDSTIIILYTSRSPASLDAHQVLQGLAHERGVRHAHERRIQAHAQPHDLDAGPHLRGKVLFSVSFHLQSSFHVHFILIIVSLSLSLSISLYIIFISICIFIFMSMSVHVHVHFYSRYSLSSHLVSLSLSLGLGLRLGLRLGVGVVLGLGVSIGLDFDVGVGVGIG